MITETEIDLRLLADIREAMGEPEEGYCSCGKHHTAQCDLCHSLINDTEIVSSDTEPVAQTINSIVSTLDEWIFQAKHPETYREIATHAIGFGQIQTGVQRLLSFIKSHEEPKLKVCTGRLTNGHADIGTLLRQIRAIVDALIAIRVREFGTLLQDEEGELMTIKNSLDWLLSDIRESRPKTRIA